MPVGKIFIGFIECANDVRLCICNKFSSTVECIYAGIYIIYRFVVGINVLLGFIFLRFTVK